MQTHDSSKKAPRPRRPIAASKQQSIAQMRVHHLEPIAGLADTLPAIRLKQGTMIAFAEFELSIMQNEKRDSQDSIDSHSI